MAEKGIKRPGWVTFAALVMLMAGAMNLIWAFEAYSNAAWLRDLSSGDFGTQFTTWAILDLILALVALGAAYSIWQGGKFGFWVGVVAAILSAVRAFFFMPWIPIGALSIIAIDLLIIYALSSNAEYFGY
jgi:hypothetical protein